MIIINKDEKDYLLSKGYKFCDHIHKTVGSGKNKTYYATESSGLMKDLFKYRELRLKG